MIALLTGALLGFAARPKEGGGGHMSGHGGMDGHHGDHSQDPYDKAEHHKDDGGGHPIADTPEGIRDMIHGDDVSRDGCYGVVGHEIHCFFAGESSKEKCEADVADA